MSSAGSVEGFELRIPGSVSNLGPGFDSLAVAVQIYLDLKVTEVRPDAPDTIETHFADGGPPARIGSKRRFVTRGPGSARRRQASGSRCRSDIPMRAGLGSSGAATVAGLRLYQQLTAPMSSADLLALAADVEGHPDNAAASLLGGLTVSCQRDDGRVTARAWRWPSDVQIVVATPEAELETPHARRVLPSTISMRDAVFNLQRALLLRPCARRWDARRSPRGAAGSVAPAGAGAARARPGRSAGAR